MKDPFPLVSCYECILLWYPNICYIGDRSFLFRSSALKSLRSILSSSFPSHKGREEYSLNSKKKSQQGWTLRMIGSIFKRATRIFRSTNLHSNIVVGAFPSRAEPTGNFSSTVDPAAMASVQETQASKRVVGKKFVIACDGGFHIVSRFQE